MTRYAHRTHTFGNPHPRHNAYVQLVQALGPGRVADILIRKWVADPDADGKWDRLLVDMERRAAA